MKLDYELELQRVATESANAVEQRLANKYNHNIETSKQENVDIHIFKLDVKSKKNRQRKKMNVTHKQLTLNSNDNDK